MGTESHLDQGRNYLSERRFEEALRELKKAEEENGEVPEIFFLLSRAHVSLSEKTGNKPLLHFAENEIRKAIELNSSCQAYHDQLIEISAKNDRLGELSREYGRKFEETGNEFYGELLKKISIIGATLIPAGASGQKKKPRLLFILHYLILPVMVAAAMVLLYFPQFNALLIFETAALVLYFGMRIKLRRRSKSDRW